MIVSARGAMLEPVRRSEKKEAMMSFRDILVALKTYPEATDISAVEQAVALADALGSRISAVACEVDIQVPGRLGFVSDAILDVPGLAAAEMRKSADRARSLLASFESAARARDILHDRIVEKCLPSQVPEVLVEWARLRDLTIFAMPANDSVDRWYAESVIFGSGRPTIVMPEISSRPPATDRIVVAWDFSRPAARAVWDALPILQKAKTVRIVTITNEKFIDGRRSGEELAKHLSRHGIAVVLDKYDAAGRSIGEALETYVAAHTADLLVMGAYGHSRVREFILGGATRSILSRPALPTFFSH
jgi:nucleotide-binding universal stress UspA family protein